jgi:hypothetical protein
MHGTIFLELQGYAQARLGADGWSRLLAEARLPPKFYLPIKEYPDEEAMALVAAAARLAGKPEGEILEDFGEFIVPGLLSMYGSLLKKEWRTLDIIQHTEETVHRVVRLNHMGARPPYLSSERASAGELVLTYTSPRRMCRFARGLIRAIARVKGEAVSIEESRCLLKGDPACVITLRAGD